MANNCAETVNYIEVVTAIVYDFTWTETPDQHITAFSWLSNHDSDEVLPYHAGRLIVQESAGSPAVAFRPVRKEWYTVLRSIVDGNSEQFSLYWDIITLDCLPQEELDKAREIAEDAVLGQDVLVTGARVLAAFIHLHSADEVSKETIVGALTFSRNYYRSSYSNELETYMDGDAGVNSALDAIAFDDHRQLYTTISSHDRRAKADTIPKQVVQD